MMTEFVVMLSEFGQSILRVLENSDQPLTSAEVVERVNVGRTNRFSEKLILDYLTLGLKNRVQEEEDGRWSIRLDASRLHGSREAKVDTSSIQNSRSLPPDVASGSLAARIYLLLSNSDSRLSVSSIARLLSDSGAATRMRDVLRILNSQLHDYVDFDDQYRWTIRQPEENVARSRSRVNTNLEFGIITTQEAERELIAFRNDRNPEKRHSESPGLERHTHTDNPAKPTAYPPVQAEPANANNIDLAERVMALLESFDRPLKATEIVSLLGGQGVICDRAEINQLLYGELRSRLIRSDSFEWSVKRASGPPAGDVPEIDIPQNEHGAELTPTVPHDRTPTEHARFEPSSSVASHLIRLELAKQITLTLNLAPRPLSMDQISWVLTKSGFDIDPSTVARCMRTLLAPIIEERQDNRYAVRTDVADDALFEAYAGLSGERLLGEVDMAGVDAEFAEAELDTAALFSTSLRGNRHLITLNTAHPAYPYLQSTLHTGNRINPNDSASGLRLIIVALAILEWDAQGQHRKQIRDIVFDLGRVVRRLLRSSSSDTL